MSEFHFCPFCSCSEKAPWLMLCVYTLSVMDAASGTPRLALAERFPSWGIESSQSLVQVLSCGCHFPNDSSKTCRLPVCLVAQGSLCWEELLQNVVWNLKVRRWRTPLGTWASQRGLPAGERSSSCPGDADTAVGGRKAAVGGNKSITYFGSKSL